MAVAQRGPVTAPDPLTGHLWAIMRGWFATTEQADAVAAGADPAAVDAEVINAATSIQCVRCHRLLADVHDAPCEPRRRETPRNAPCWCGSGAKFKRCHGTG